MIYYLKSFVYCPPKVSEELKKSFDVSQEQVIFSSGNIDSFNKFALIKRALEISITRGIKPPYFKSIDNDQMKIFIVNYS